MDNLSRSAVDVWLITGATGLVGRFMLAELLRARQHTAVIVREKTTSPLSARIEEALCVFEENSQFGRPRLLAGDLTQPGLGLTERDREWLEHQRLGVIHCAASIRFSADSADGEPYLSNVAGTRHLLDVLSRCSVESFLYVSTAYVTSRAIVQGAPVIHGPRTETAIAKGATGGNDYESSKIVAEQMVADCQWLGKKTICRPSIIVGDSRTGYSSTFHGFYAPLKIGLEFVKRFGFNEQAGAWFRSQLGLNEADKKNFVPVDWVAKAIVQLALHPELQGSVYHLTNPTPTTCIDVQNAVQRTLAKFAEGIAPPPDSTGHFREQLGVYESYLNNDPEFDCRNTRAALPDLVCPKVGVELLEMLGDYAISVNFGWPKLSAQIPPYAKIMQSLTQTSEVSVGADAELLELNVLGNSAPGALHFVRSNNHWFLAKGRFRREQIKYRMMTTAALLAGCISHTGDTNDTSRLVESGQLVFQGNPSIDRLVFINDWVQDLKLLAPLRSENRAP